MTSRLFITDELHAEATVTLDGNQAHYLIHVMRLVAGSIVLLFNGRDGEWSASITHTAKKIVTLYVQYQTRQQRNAPDMWLLFAPIKAGHIDFLVEKATELGVSRLIPVRTDRTIISRINHDRLTAHAVEAAGQSERLDVPVIAPYLPLATILGEWDASRSLIYGDESGKGAAAPALLASRVPPIAALIGPEGGFSPSEFALLEHYPFTSALSLGTRILRADTAALAALTLLQLYCGDWYSEVFSNVNDSE